MKKEKVVLMSLPKALADDELTQTVGFIDYIANNKGGEKPISVNIPGNPQFVMVKFMDNSSVDSFVAEVKTLSNGGVPVEDSNYSICMPFGVKLNIEAVYNRTNVVPQLERYVKENSAIINKESAAFFLTKPFKEVRDYRPL